ncbi:MAG: protein kinase, partial [Myxococcales bacterium]|nr:protein kinase [Myxococcales bacterium]
MNSATTQRLVSTCPECGAENSPASRFCNQCGSSLEHSGAPKREVVSPEKIADPLLGMVIAERYRIVAPIGRGGMGVVYRVEHVRIGKLMALKLLTGELTSDSELVGRFKREALMVSKLSHPNTVQVFDFGTSDGLTYLAMEFLDGRDLGRLIEDSGCLDPVRVARLTIQICSSLAEAHGQGMIHRDLKPENIIVLQTREGELVKVLDFGLAKLRESSEMLEVTSRGAIVGTPYYMSPEQVRGEEVDQRSDIYSLGALMYKAL